MGASTYLNYHRCYCHDITNIVESGVKHHNTNPSWSLANEWFILDVCNGSLTPLSIIYQLYRGDQFLLVEETRVPRENYRPVTSHWQTLSQISQMSPWWRSLSCDKKSISCKDWITWRQWRNYSVILENSDIMRCYE
jgi:hypothetical protein